MNKSDRKIILTVRATKDGMYANYYYKGPIDADEGYFPGEIFQVDATPYEMKDERGRPILELDEEGGKIPVLDAKGKTVLDEKGKKTFKIKMATFFSSEWMERVPNDTEVTYPDRPAWRIPEAYRVKSRKPIKPVELPQELAGLSKMEIPASVNKAENVSAIPVPEEVL